jgi:hypothetical protein
MRRREFIAVLGCAAVWPIGLHATVRLAAMGFMICCAVDAPPYCDAFAASPKVVETYSSALHENAGRFRKAYQVTSFGASLLNQKGTGRFRRSSHYYYCVINCGVNVPLFSPRNMDSAIRWRRAWR